MYCKYINTAGIWSEKWPWASTPLFSKSKAPVSYQKQWQCQEGIAGGQGQAQDKQESSSIPAGPC